MDKLESGVVALETECGPVYLQPSGWERLYMLWTFRHFNSLPLKTLNSRQRRMVERLPRCTVRLRSGPDRTRVIGTVEGATLLSLPTTLVVEEAAIEMPVHAAIVPAELRDSASSASHERLETRHETLKNSTRTLSAPQGNSGGSRYALLLATVSLSVVALVAAWPRLRLFEHSAASKVQTSEQVQENQTAAPEIQSIPTETPIESSAFQQTSDVIKPVADLPSANSSVSDIAVSKPIVVSATAIPAAEPKAVENNEIPEALSKPNYSLTQKPKNPILASIQEKVVQEGEHRMQVAGPPRRIIYPEYPQTSVRGKVNLKAVIGLDGRVRNVTVLSGNRILSAAAARAIRQWRYNPSYENGAPVETETNVGVLFVSTDVISITFPGATQISQ